LQGLVFFNRCVERHRRQVACNDTDRLRASMERALRDWQFSDRDRLEWHGASTASPTI
jgi:hypothetical protein